MLVWLLNAAVCPAFMDGYPAIAGGGYFFDGDLTRCALVVYLEFGVLLLNSDGIVFGFGVVWGVWAIACFVDVFGVICFSICTGVCFGNHYLGGVVARSNGGIGAGATGK